MIHRRNFLRTTAAALAWSAATEAKAAGGIRVLLRNPSSHAVLPLDVVSVTLGDSIIAHPGSLSIINWVNYLLGGRMFLPIGYNQGVSGNTTTDTLARQPVGLALNPNVYFIEGGTNDPPATWQSVSVPNIAAEVAAALATPSIELVVLRTLSKRSDIVFNPTLLANFNNSIRAMVAPTVVIADWAASSFDPVTQTTDGLHPDTSGTYTLAKVDVAAIISWFTPQTRLYSAYTDFNSLLSLGALAGTGGTKTGNITGFVANGCTINNQLTGTTCVASKEVDVDGFNVQRVDLGGTSSVNGYLFMQIPQTFSGIGGEQYEAWTKVEISDHNRMNFLQMTCDGCETWGDIFYGYLPENISGVIRTPPGVLAGVDTSNILTLWTHWQAGAAAATIKISSRPTWRKRT